MSSAATGLGPGPGPRGPETKPALGPSWTRARARLRLEPRPVLGSGASRGPGPSWAGAPAKAARAKSKLGHLVTQGEPAPPPAERTYCIQAAGQLRVRGALGREKNAMTLKLPWRSQAGSLNCPLAFAGVSLHSRVLPSGCSAPPSQRKGLNIIRLSLSPVVLHLFSPGQPLARSGPGCVCSAAPMSE